MHRVREVVVDAGGAGDYTSLQQALDATTPEWGPLRIRLRNGTYTEKVVIPAGRAVHISGESADRTVVAFDDFAGRTHADGRPLGTFRTASCTVHADGVRIEDLTIANTAGAVGQAVALAVYGADAQFRRVRLLGYQDTLLTAGCGPQYYGDCYIEGRVDYIFGPAPAVFDRCHVHSVDHGYVTAASTPVDVPSGYVFYRCRLTAPETAAGRVYLGRPWRGHAAVAFVDCELGTHIRPEGWHNWNAPEREHTARYAEYGSRGPGAEAAARVPWAICRPLADVPPELAGVLQPLGFQRP